MIEIAMYVGLGFFAACLIMVFVANAVWRRAVRLTTKRVQAAMPVSLAEIKADRDQLRAEFAMATRRLEILVDELKQKSQAQLVDVAKKNDQLRLLLAEVRTRAETIRAQEAAEQTLRGDLLRAEGEHADTRRLLADAETRLVDAARNLAERERMIAAAETLADQRRVEIAALRTNVARFEDDVADLGRSLTALERDREERQARLVTAETALAEERARQLTLESRVAAAEETTAKLADEIGRLQARLSEQTAEIAGRVAETERVAGRLQETIAERDRLAEEMSRRMAEAEVRSAAFIADADATRKVRADLEAKLVGEKAAREAVEKKLRTLNDAAAENWERERVENGLLRERINDLAAQITAMTSTLEAEASPIERLIFEAEKGARQSPALPSAALGADTVALTRPEDPRRTSLAERVRALQARATIGR